MQITLRFSYPEDADLLLMRACEKRDFCTKAKECILSFAEGRNYTYTFPDVDQDVISSLPHKSKVNFLIADNKNPEIVSFLGKYEVSMRKSIVKSLLRASFREYPSKLVLMAIGLTGLSDTQEPREEVPGTGQEAGAAPSDGNKKTGPPAEKKKSTPAEGQKPIPSIKATTSVSAQEWKKREAPDKIHAQEPQRMSQTSGPQEAGPAPAADDEKERSLFEMFLNM